MYKRIASLVIASVIIFAFATAVIAQYTGTIRVGNGFFGTFQTAPEGVTPEVMMAGPTYSAIDMYSRAADSNGTIVGIINFGFNANVPNDTRVARIFGYTEGTTAGNRGGQLRIQTKADGGAFQDRWSIENTGTLQSYGNLGTATVHQLITPATAIDGVVVTGSATANPATVTIAACSNPGGDTNCNLNLLSKGTGTVQANGVTITAAPTITIKKGSGLGNYTTASTTFVRVDSTNLAYTVTVPTGQKVLIVANAMIANDASAGFVSMAIADGTADNTGILIDSSPNGLPGTSVSSFGLTYVFIGDGASHTFNLQYKTSAGTITMRNATSTQVPAMTFWLGVAN